MKGIPGKVPNDKTTARFLGEAEALKKRGISERTNNFYRIYRYGNTLRFPYYGADGTVAGFKIKTKSKDLKARNSQCELGQSGALFSKKALMASL